MSYRIEYLYDLCLFEPLFFSGGILGPISNRHTGWQPVPHGNLRRMCGRAPSGDRTVLLVRNKTNPTNGQKLQFQQNGESR